MSIGIVEICEILSIDVQVSKLDGTRLFFRNEDHHVKNGYKGMQVGSDRMKNEKTFIEFVCRVIARESFAAGEKHGMKSMKDDLKTLLGITND